MRYFKIPILVLCFIDLKFNFNSGSVSAQDLSDPDISDAVQVNLQNADEVPAHLIDVDTDQGIVQLKGVTDNLLAVYHAEDIARSVSGVRGVVNLLEVKEKKITDEKLQKDIVETLKMNPAISIEDMNISVDQSEAILTGKVNSWQERMLAERVVAGVQGLTAINNQLTFSVEKGRSDQQISDQIRSLLNYTARIDDRMIDIEVNDGQVILSGAVGSAWEKKYAEELAMVAGVSSVDTENLKVTKWARDDEFRQQKYTAKSDQAIRQAIKDAFLYDPRVFSFNISVDVSQGKVTLAGKVDNLRAKRAAASDARNIVGVWRVNNQISVRPGETVSDSTLESRVRTALRKDPYIEKFEMEVTAFNGEIYLKGEVDNSFEKYQAEEIAATVPGVVEVDNNLRVPDDYPQGYYSNWVPEDTPLPVKPSKNDQRLLEDVVDQLQWSPFVNEDEIKVTIDDGSVILKGKVDTWTEKQEAEENAYDAGAVYVYNQLEVEYDVAD